MNKRKTDANQQEIMDALRKVGAEVESLHRLGRGVPDLLVAFGCRWYVMEVKTEEGGLLETQEKWIDKFGRVAPVYVVRSVEDALEVLGVQMDFFLSIV